MRWSARRSRRSPGRVHDPVLSVRERLPRDTGSRRPRPSYAGADSDTSPADYVGVRFVASRICAAIHVAARRAGVAIHGDHVVGADVMRPGTTAEARGDEGGEPGLVRDRRADLDGTSSQKTSCCC